MFGSPFDLSIFGTNVLEGYGLTETSPVATFNQKGFRPEPGTVGKAIWGVEVEVAKAEVDERIELLPTGELGEIVIRGHNIFKGYLNKPEATAAAIVDGWFRSGDIAYADAEGWFYFLHRAGGGIRRNGDFVNATLVETVLAQHPAVRDVFVYGVETAANVAGERTLVAARRSQVTGPAASRPHRGGPWSACVSADCGPPASRWTADGRSRRGGSWVVFRGVRRPG